MVKYFFYLGIASIVSSVVLFASQNTITVYIAKKIRIQTTLYFISLCAAFVGSLVVILWFYRLDIGLVVFAYVINTLAIGEILGKKTFYDLLKIRVNPKIFICFIRN